MLYLDKDERRVSRTMGCLPCIVNITHVYRMSYQIHVSMKQRKIVV